LDEGFIASPRYGEKQQPVSHCTTLQHTRRVSDVECNHMALCALSHIMYRNAALTKPPIMPPWPSCISYRYYSPGCWC